MKNLGLRKFPACLYQGREIASTAEFSDNVDVAIVPVKVNQFKNKPMPELLEYSNLCDQIVS